MTRRTRMYSRLKSENAFLDLPLDVLFEILQLVDPLTLLYLARTNKSLREFLLNRRNAPIWRASLKAVDSAPPPAPAYMDEPAWCRLLFEEICHVCLSPLEHDYQSDPIWWEFRARFCEECSKEKLLVQIPSRLRAAQPSNTDKCIFSSGVFPRINGAYLAKDVNAFADKYCNIKSVVGSGSKAARKAEKGRLLRERRALTKAITAYSKIGKAWMGPIVQARIREVKSIKAARCTDVQTKLREAGWSDFFVGREREFLNNHPLVGIPQPLSDAEWDEIAHEVTTEFETHVKPRVLSHRMRTLQETFPDITPYTAGLTIPPRLVDVALLPEVRALLENTDLKAVIPREQIEKTVAPQLQELPAWSAALEKQVRQHAKAWLEARFPDIDLGTADPLSHALVWFECTGGCCKGHFDSGCWKLWPCNGSGILFTSKPTTYEQVAESVLRQDACTLERMFQLPEGWKATLLESVIKAFGMDPRRATCEEMDGARGKLRCLHCDPHWMQPESWRDALIGHRHWGNGGGDGVFKVEI